MLVQLWAFYFYGLSFHYYLLLFLVLSKKYVGLINFFWGSFAIGGSVLWHWDESKVIIGQIIGFVPDVGQYFMTMLQLILIAFNLCVILLLNLNQYLSYQQLRSEIGKIAVLSLLFYFTPMLVGFALYFALWHSLSSLNSQLNYYKKLWPHFTLVHYYRQAAPYTLLAIVGFGLMVFGHPFILPNVSIISTFVVFIACVTLPHIFLVDESYQH
jgi:beta-carotene 15,15'-dioxygenase